MTQCVKTREAARRAVERLEGALVRVRSRAVRGQ
jgi:hypothetical protein